MRLTPFIPTMLMILTLVGSVEGQSREWGLSTELGLSAFSGGARDSASSGTVGHPSRATSIGFRLDANSGKTRISVGLLYASTGLEISGSGLQVIARSAFKLFEVAPELAIRVFSLSSGGRVHVHGGMVIDRWKPAGEETRMLLGGLVAASVELPVSHRLTAGVRWETSITKSVFRQGEVPPEFELRRSLRHRVGLGVRYRL
jgi:hypothetical protein